MGTSEATTDQQQDTTDRSRARRPDTQGHIERDGVRVFYEVFGRGEPTILFVAPWTLVSSRLWKMQVAHLADHHRVIVIDPRGNGRSDRPGTVEAYADAEFAQDALDVLDATGTEQAILVGASRGAQRVLLLATERPERVAGAVFVCPLFPASRSPISLRMQFLEHPLVKRGFMYPPLVAKSWGKANAVHWRRDLPDFVEWFARTVASQGHSTRGVEDVIDWSQGTDPESLIRSIRAPAAAPLSRRRQLELAQRVRCPVLVIQGTADKVTAYADGDLLAQTTGGRLVPVRGGDHAVMARRPVEVNLAIREFAAPAFRRDPTVHRSDDRPRALFISSPIGLGHARRDVAIANELRALVPALQIDWLAQDPVTRVLEAEGERIHPASARLASESAHIAAEAGEHDLHCFEAFRRMDEILLRNFMVFDDVVRDERYDLWIGDEAWELDHHLHENPGRKHAPFAWLTDFVGWLPMPDGGAHEAALTADYNGEMVEHVRDHPGIRDRAIFVGTPEDVIGGSLGPGLPGIREWTAAHFEFSGYITGFDQDALGDRERLRAELGYGPHERVCVVTVGGSGVGSGLLRRVAAAFGAAKAAVPELRMILVAGPRIDPATLPAADGLEVRPYVHDLYRHLAACDLAVVQGGLTTSMELTAAGTPFLYFPLRHHFEQAFHVPHRLDRYRAGRRMDFDQATPEVIAAAIAAEIGRDTDYAPVERDGARRAARSIAELLG